MASMLIFISGSHEFQDGLASGGFWSMWNVTIVCELVPVGLLFISVSESGNTQKLGATLVW
jgi:hypothetical protein